MASVAVIAANAIVNVLTFTGSKFLFSKLSDHGKAEMKRYDLAMEKLQKDRDEWCKKTTTEA